MLQSPHQAAGGRLVQLHVVQSQLSTRETGQQGAEVSSHVNEHHPLTDPAAGGRLAQLHVVHLYGAAHKLRDRFFVFFCDFFVSLS